MAPNADTEPTLLSRLPVTVLLLGVTSLFADVGSEMVFPLLPVFMVRTLGDGCGNGIPLLVVGLTAGGMAARLRNAAWLRWVERASGAVLMGLGVHLLWSA